MLAVIIGREGDGGAMGLFADSGGQDANHALMPVLVEQGQAPGQAFDVEGHGGQQVLGLGFHVFFDAAAFAVEVVQFPGQAQGFVAAVGEQAGDADAHVVQPAGGVQARAHHKAEVGSADFGVVAASDFQQGQDARSGFALADAADALLYENPVVVVQRYYVRHGSQCDQVQQAAQVGLRVRQQVVVSQVFAQGCQHIEHHTHAGGILAQERAAGLIGVHDGIGVWQFVTGQVVVGDDNLDTQLPGGTHTFDGGDAVIHGHQQVGQIAFFLQPVDDSRRQAVTIGEAARHPEVDGCHAQHGQAEHGYRSTGRAIGIEVPQHHHPLFLHNGLGQQFNRAINAAKLQG